MESDAQNFTSRKLPSESLALRCRLLRSRRCCRRRRRGAARTPSGTLLALQRKLFLGLQIFVQTPRLVFDHHVLHAQAALQLGNQLAVRGANLLVHVNTFAVFGHAISQLARAPLLGLFHLAAFFRAGVLDHGKNFLDLLFRRCRTDDEHQIVMTLFHDDLFLSQLFCVRAASTASGAARQILLLSLPRLIRFFRLCDLAAVVLAHRPLPAPPPNYFYGLAPSAPHFLPLLHFRPLPRPPTRAPAVSH